MSGPELKYFTLKPKGENAYAEASRIAMLAYASAIEAENLYLAQDLRQWVYVTTPKK